MGVLIAWGHNKKTQSRRPEKIRANFFESHFFQEKKTNKLRSYDYIHFTVAPRFLGKIKRKSQTSTDEIIEIFNHAIAPYIEQYSSIADAILEMQRIAEERYGVLYSREYPHGKRGFGGDTIRNVIATKFKNIKRNSKT